MSWVDERIAFETRLKANFTGGIKVQYPGVPFTPENNTPWVKMQLLPGTTKRISLGDVAVFRERGMLLLMVYAPAKTGSNQALVIADTLGPIFHEAIFSHGDSGTIRCFVPRIDNRGPTTDGVWYQVNLTVEFERDRIL